VGAITLLSALLPGIQTRTRYVESIVPAVFPAAATTGAAAVGVILILLSRSLRRGKFRAWILATVLAGTASALHILKGLDVEEAVLCLLLVVLLLSSRHEFEAKPDPRSIPHLAMVLVLGPVVATGLGFLWLVVDGDGQVRGTTFADRVTFAFLGLVGIHGPVQFVSGRDSERAAAAMVVLGAAVLLLALFVAMQPADGPHPLSAAEGESLRDLLDDWGQIDSLSYFALRDDRAVMFSPSGKAALTYRVVGTVSLAAGDPLGDPEAWCGAIDAWLAEARAFGWIPAVLGASERGATAFDRAGFEVLELGDEAIVHVEDFSLEGRNMRGVRQAVARCNRADMTVSAHRLCDLSPDLLAQAQEKVDSWREGPVERGFSMALGRFGAPEDGAAVLVIAADCDGEFVGLLHLVPWGRDGLSLDLMRRDPAATNGIIEAMITHLMAEAPALGVRRVSLNFAVFRSVFARGDKLGAGPVLRVWRSILLWASKFWQIESLYRANAKYQPQWVPRFIGYRSSSDLPRVATAALRAEAFLVAPGWIRNWSAQRGVRALGRPAVRNPPGVGLLGHRLSAREEHQQCGRDGKPQTCQCDFGSLGQPEVPAARRDQQGDGERALDHADEQG
jgi:lysyl-tRNA synthetase class 2